MQMQKYDTRCPAVKADHYCVMDSTGAASGSEHVSRDNFSRRTILAFDHSDANAPRKYSVQSGCLLQSRMNDGGEPIHVSTLAIGL